MYYYAIVGTNGSGASVNSTQMNALTRPAAPDNSQVSPLWNTTTGRRDAAMESLAVGSSHQDGLSHQVR